MHACFKILYEKSTARFKKTIRTGKIIMANLYISKLYCTMYSTACTIHF